jgi:hypothetical protein
VVDRDACGTAQSAMHFTVSGTAALGDMTQKLLQAQQQAHQAQQQAHQAQQQAQQAQQASLNVSRIASGGNVSKGEGKGEGKGAW